AFWIDAFEVTNEQYQRFLLALGHSPPEHWKGTQIPEGKARHPVVGIRHEDAEAYATWAGKKLPTRAQWMRAFRGDTEQLFPWGNEFERDRTNVAENAAFRTTTPIDATPRDVSPLG